MNEALAQPEMPFEGPVPDVDLLPRLVAWLGRSEWSGHVAVRSGEIERRLYLMDGHVQTATSNAPEERMTSFLMASGLIDETSVEQAATHLGTDERGLHFARKLVELGMLSAEQLAGAELERVVALSETILSLRNGVYRCEVGAPPTEMVSHALSVPRLVATSVLSRWEETWAMNVLGGMGSVLRLDMERLPDHEATGADEAYDLTLLRVDGRTPLAGVLERAPLPELAALRFLAACRLLGIVVVSEAPAAAPPPSRESASSEPEPERELPREPLGQDQPLEPDAFDAKSLDEGEPTVPGFYRPPAAAPAPRRAEPLMKEEPSKPGVGRWLLIALIIGLLGVVAWFGWVGLSEMSGSEVPAPASGEAESLRRSLLAAILTIVASLASAADGPYELRLRSGERMLADEAVLRDGSWRLKLPSGIRLTLPKAKVLEVRELAGREPRESERLSGLNWAGGPEQQQQKHGSSLEARSEDERRLLRQVTSLRAKRRLSEAEALLRAELVERPGDALRLVLLGQTLVDGDRFREALEPLRLASPGSNDSLRRARDLALAEAYSRLDRVDEALRSLESTPEDAAGSVAAARERLARDQVGSASLDRVETTRFSIHLPSGSGPIDTGPLVRQLDSAWDELEAALGGAPRDRVVVVIYPGREFWETTGMGGNVGGLYDGKVRVPSGSLDPPSPRLAAVLRHELAHAFVDALTGGRADPVWHEGIAEHFERSSLIPALERRLVAAHRRGDWPPSYDHATAHSRLEYFLARWSMSGLRDLLREWSRRGTIQAALQSVAGLDEAALDEAWARALEEKWER